MSLSNFQQGDHQCLEYGQYNGERSHTRVKWRFKKKNGNSLCGNSATDLGCERDDLELQMEEEVISIEDAYLCMEARYWNMFVCSWE